MKLRNAFLAPTAALMLLTLVAPMAIIAVYSFLTTADDIIDYCKQHLAAFKYPRVVEFRPSLPKGPSGKILKRELRAPYWAGQATNV